MDYLLALFTLLGSIFSYFYGYRHGVKSIDAKLKECVRKKDVYSLDKVHLAIIPIPHEFEGKSLGMSVHFKEV